MKTRAYVMGRPVPIEGINNPGSVILEVEMEDGRTVQLAVYRTGQIDLRAWGNIAAKVGNMAQVDMHCTVVPQEQTTCEICYHRLPCNCRGSNEQETSDP